MKIKDDKAKQFKLNKFTLSPVAIIAISFFLVIFIGSIFLILPISHNPGANVTYLDALFTSTSCTCVTGLVSVREGVADSFSIFGKVVMAILIQLGGLGVTTLAVIFFMIASRKLTFSEQSLIKESWNLNNLRGIKKIFFLVLLVSFSFEIFGACLSFLDFYFVHKYDMATSWGYAFFHSISSFNNAGFDIIGNSSLIEFENDIFLNLITSFLIIAGGLGFFVNIDIIKKKFHFKKFTLHTKIVLLYTLILIILGTLSIYLIELTNQVTEVSFMGSFFMSVSTRTAGFTMYNLGTFNDATIIIMCILMFIGASPGGTGGGIKTTTFALLLSYLRGVITGKRPYAFRRSINKDLIRRALLIIILGFSFFVIGFTLICVFEGNYNFIDLTTGEKLITYREGATRYNAIDFGFEAMSAFGTVGLSTGITSYLTPVSQVILIVLMYIGRIGPLTISTAFKGKNTVTYHYAEEDVSIG